MTGPAIEIAAGALSATVLPAAGAALGRFDIDIEGRREPVFLAGDHPGRSGPFTLACNLLVPWSNRISGGGFETPGGRVDLAPNVAGEPSPIHGNGFQEAWTVVAAGSDRVELALRSDGPGAFAYDARVRYALDVEGLSMTLSVTNRSQRTLPYGLGFHPWLPRSRALSLFAPAMGVWLEDERHLPTRHLAVADAPDFDFRMPRPAPAGWINNALTGWTGRARVEWPERRLALSIEAATLLATLIVYSPGDAAGYLCVEPVSHPVDAHNRRDDPNAAGLVDLAPGASLDATCRFRVEITDRTPRQ